MLSRVLPRYRLYSKHSDRRYWTGTSIGTRYQGPSFRTHEQSLLLEQKKNKRRGSAIGHQPSLHLNVVLSKAALSGPSVCLRARAPLPTSRLLSADRARAHSSCVPCWSRSSDRAKRAAKLQALAFRWLLGARQVILYSVFCNGYEPCAKLTHGRLLRSLRFSLQK